MSSTYSSNYNIPVPANKCSMQNRNAAYSTVLNKCNLPLEQCGVFLQEQYPYKVWSIPLENTPCPLTHISSQRSSIALRKGNIYLRNISFFYIEHPFRKFNMLEHVSIIKECSSLLITLSYEEAAFFQNWMTFAWHMYYSPWSAQPSFSLV